MVDLSSLIDDLSDESIFSELPVDLETFMGPGYLQMDDYITLSPLQKDIINNSTQIFDLETLKREYGPAEGRRIYKYTKTQIVCMLGKGSGKDLCAEISCAYLVYKLLCLKDPAKYFGKPPGDAIDILNVAVNSDQAQRVFFKGFTNMIKRSPWFADKVVAPKQRVYEFEKSVAVHSGHSEMEAFEGLNTIMVVLDEISAFSMLIADNAATDVSPAEATYLMYKASLTSRFPDIGKLVMLSWPRYKGDFISTKYDEFTKVKDVVEQSVELAINPEMPIDTPGNKLVIEWTEDIIHDYTTPGAWALRKPSWKVNPKMKIRDYIGDFLSNYRDSRNRFAATPTDGSDGFFSDHAAIERNLSLRNGVNPETGVFEPWFKARADREYFIHVDLARKHDRAVVAIAHVDKWRYQEVFAGQFEDTPYVIVDAYRYWTPTREQQISFIDVKNFIMDVARAGFNIEVVTFDQWESTEMINYFNGVGMRAEKMSVGLEQYNDLKLMLVEDRVKVPEDPILKKELEQLKLTKNMKNVDHPAEGCFTGDTRIPLLDGTRPMISELDGEEVWVYSATPDGKIVPGKGRGRMTKKTNKLVDVVLDSGAVIRCTPEHPFMLRSGSYKAAEELRPGIDRLMPINQVWPVNGGYERVTDKDGLRTLTHHMVVEAMGEAIDEGHIVHHKNHIKTDNRPENLEVMTLSGHSAYHTKGRHDDEDYRGALYSGLKKWNSLPETREKRSRHMRSMTSEWYRARGRVAKTFRSDITIDSLLAIKDDPDITNANAAGRACGCGRNVVIRVLRDHGYESWDDFVLQSGNNHKVRAVIHIELDEPVAVYDLEVDKWSNFALSAGVFVHNSKDIADAVAGAVHNAFARSFSDSNEESEVLTLSDVHARMAGQREEERRNLGKGNGLIMPPKRADRSRGDDEEWGVRVL